MKFLACRSRSRDDALAARRAFDAVVRAVVVVVAVAVVFEVGEVVLALVAHEVVERVAVVRRDEVDAVVRPAAAGLVEVAGAGEPRGHRAGHAAVAAPEAADVVAVVAVPLGPTLVGERADLVTRRRRPTLRR